MEGETDIPRCPLCGEPIGVYEPIYLLAAGKPPLKLSRADHPQLPADSLVHQACYDRTDGPAADSE